MLGISCCWRCAAQRRSAASSPFGGWANLAHAPVMAAQEYRNLIERQELVGVVVFAVVGIALIVLPPHNAQNRRG